jgi:hypothetical protein
MLEMVRLIGRLQEENRNLAGQLGYVQAQLHASEEQVRALEAARIAPDMLQDAPGGDSDAEPQTRTGESSKPEKRPWWRFWAA